MTSINQAHQSVANEAPSSSASANSVSNHWEILSKITRSLQSVIKRTPQSDSSRFFSSTNDLKTTRILARELPTNALQDVIGFSRDLNTSEQNKALNQTPEGRQDVLLNSSSAHEIKDALLLNNRPNDFELLNKNPIFRSVPPKVDLEFIDLIDTLDSRGFLPESLTNRIWDLKTDVFNQVTDLDLNDIETLVLIAAIAPKAPPQSFQNQLKTIAENKILSLIHGITPDQVNNGQAKSILDTVRSNPSLSEPIQKTALSKNAAVEIMIAKLASGREQSLPW